MVAVSKNYVSRQGGRLAQAELAPVHHIGQAKYATENNVSRVYQLVGGGGTLPRLSSPRYISSVRQFFLP